MGRGKEGDVLTSGLGDLWLRGRLRWTPVAGCWSADPDEIIERATRDMIPALQSLA